MLAPQRGWRVRRVARCFRWQVVNEGTSTGVAYSRVGEDTRREGEREREREREREKRVAYGVSSRAECSDTG